jgi:hypothetical protein
LLFGFVALSVRVLSVSLVSLLFEVGCIA